MQGLPEVGTRRLRLADGEGAGERTWPLAVVACRPILAVSASLLVLLPGGCDCDGATDEFAWCRVQPLPASRDLHAAWARAPDDVWAAGEGERRSAGRARRGRR